MNWEAEAKRLDAEVEELRAAIQKQIRLKDAARTRARSLDDRLKRIQAGLKVALHGPGEDRIISQPIRHELAVLLDLATH